MELFLKLLPYQLAFADGKAVTVKTQLFTVIQNGAHTFVSILKWLVLLLLLIKICILGFKIITESKNSSDALTKIKDEGLALFIGFFVVMGAALIQNALEDTMTQLSTGSQAETTITAGTDIFAKP